MKLLILNGPNINLLGVREPGLYGKEDYDALVHLVELTCRSEGIQVEIVQSNHEGALVDAIQEAREQVDGIIINPAAYAHTSIAILDALKAVNLPAVEVHLTDIALREDFRRNSYTALGCLRTIKGRGLDGYREAILYLKSYLEEL